LNTSGSSGTWGPSANNMAKAKGQLKSKNVHLKLLVEMENWQK
jgi:hypothetical protein